MHSNVRLCPDCEAVWISTTRTRCELCHAAKTTETVQPSRLPGTGNQRIPMRGAQTRRVRADQKK